MTDKKDTFLNVVFKHGQVWVDENGARCNVGFGSELVKRHQPCKVCSEGSGTAAPQPRGSDLFSPMKGNSWSFFQCELRRFHTPSEEGRREDFRIS